jgi:2-phospho-L-lactate transferase/gluconeogenesis factor (CofD/UPF0052 family)
MGKIGGMLLAVLFAATACSAPAAAVEEAPEPVANVTAVKGQLVAMSDATDATIQAMMDSVCRMYASGKSEAEVTALVIAASAATQIGNDGLKVARAAVKHQCPEFG